MAEATTEAVWPAARSLPWRNSPQTRGSLRRKQRGRQRLMDLGTGWSQSMWGSWKPSRQYKQQSVSSCHSLRTTTRLQNTMGPQMGKLRKMGPFKKISLSAVCLSETTRTPLTTPCVKHTSLVAQTVNGPPALWESWVRSLGWEDPLEEEMATHSSTLAWRIPWTEEPGRLQSMGLQRVRHDWVTNSLFHLCKAHTGSHCGERFDGQCHISQRN